MSAQLDTPLPETDSQCAAILAALRSGRALTPMDALREFGCFRLGARIWDLKQAGHNIENEWETDGKRRWAKYRLIPPKGTQYKMF